MNVFEFKKKSEIAKWKAFHYLSENQKDYFAAEPQFNLSFQQMLVYCNPNVVAFKNNKSNILQIGAVKGVEINELIPGYADALLITNALGKSFVIVAST